MLSVVIWSCLVDGIARHRHGQNRILVSELVDDGTRLKTYEKRDGSEVNDVCNATAEEQGAIRRNGLNKGADTAFLYFFASCRRLER